MTLRRVIVEPDKGEKFVGPLKARDDKATCTVRLPDVLIPVLDQHLREFVGDGANAWVFRTRSAVRLLAFAIPLVAQ